jgi:hypothetical protein
MNLADIFSGGKNSAAEDTLKSQLAELNKLPTPSAASLTLPQLEQFVSAGILTPEEAQSYLVKSNAYDKVGSDNAGMESELATLGELQNIVNSGGADAEEQASVQRILNKLGTSEAGDNAAILTDASRRGVANSGMTMAARLAANQNSATNANQNALDVAAAEEARNLSALTAKGQLGGQVQGQQYAAAGNRANAANAIAQFNAQQQQEIEKMNVGENNAAKAANLANAQDISNKNVTSSQEQERSIPAAQQQAFADALSKASAGMSGAEAVAKNQSEQGQQNAGILGGLLGTAGTVGAAYLTGNPYAALATTMAQNNTPNTNVSTAKAATGGRIVSGGVERPMNMTSGGPVPGAAAVPGDSAANDTQLAKLSPGEIVLPRTVAGPAMAGDTSKVLDFLRSLPKPAERQIHPKAVLDTLRALNMHHQGAI